MSEMSDEVAQKLNCITVNNTPTSIKSSQPPHPTLLPLPFSTHLLLFLFPFKILSPRSLSLSHFPHARRFRRLDLPPRFMDPETHAPALSSLS